MPSGPAPKDPSKRARRNAEPVPMRILPKLLAEQPELPEFDVQVEIDGDLTSQRFVWPERTREWWQMWADSPLSTEFTATDWSELMDTALIHARVWSGDLKWMPELRLRTAKYGATPEDRLRLRIQFAQAEEAEDRTGTRVTSRERFRGIRVAQERIEPA